MELALSQLPLVLFTTLAPIGAGAFLPLFFLYLRSAYSKPVTPRIDRLTLVPVIFAFIGFICALFHLANPANSLNILLTVGKTPLANEVVSFGVFLILAIAYWAFVTVKRWVAPEVRMICTGIVMTAGLVAVIFMGIAYQIPAIPIWNGPRAITSVLSVWLFGGTSLGLFLISRAEPRDNNTYADELIAKVVIGLGGLFLMGTSLSIFMVGNTMDSAMVDVVANANSLLPAQYAIQIFVVLAIVSACLARKKWARPLLTLVLVLSLVACFLGRLCFYGMQISIAF